MIVPPTNEAGTETSTAASSSRSDSAKLLSVSPPSPLRRRPKRSAPPPHSLTPAAPTPSLPSLPGPHLVAKPYADWEVVTIFNRKLVSTWSAHGFGDFALALRPPSVPPPLDPSTTWEYREASPSSPTLDLDSLTWIGYTCLRDAHLTSLKNTKEPSPAVVALLWEELVEVKYGLDEDYWSQGYATEAVGALQEWAVGRFGIRRFVGACIPGNKGSAKVLTKLGYRETEVSYAFIGFGGEVLNSFYTCAELYLPRVSDEGVGARS